MWNPNIQFKRARVQESRAACWGSTMKKINVISSIVCLSLAPILTAQTPAATMQAAPAVSRTSDSTVPPDPQLQSRYPRYEILSQDVLLVTFPLTPELNQTLTVQPDGYINLQNGGSVHVSGLTVPNAVKAIKKAYVGVLHDPIVNVDLEEFHKPQFTVTGQVGKPGQYDLSENTTVAEAIAVAGGLQSSAKEQAFLFHRTSKDWFKVEKINLKDVYNGKHVNEDAYLKPGDMVFVPESKISKFRKYVPYSLNAGTYLAPTP